MKKSIILFISSLIYLFCFTGCDEFELDYDNTYSSEALIILITTIIMFIIVVYLTFTISSFKKELRYINNEIARNDGKEKEYWLKRKRQLWLSLIPFVRY